MITRLVNTDPLFRSDNNLVYSLLDEATRGTIYASTIKPFARMKNGRSTWNSIVTSHAGDDKWEIVKKDKLNFLMNHTWYRRTYSLDKFTGLHRSAYVLLQEASLHVDCQLPTEHSRVGFLMDNIVNNDPDLWAALASIRVNTDGMRNDFESAVPFLLPTCPYTKYKSNQRSRGGRGAEISDIQLKNKGQSKTGVDFRWHTKEEYAKLTKAQRQELYQWQRTKDGQSAKTKHFSNKNGKSGKGKTCKQLEAHVHSLQQKLKASAGNKAGEDYPSYDEIRAYIAAATGESNGNDSNSK